MFCVEPILQNLCIIPKNLLLLGDLIYTYCMQDTFTHAQTWPKSAYNRGVARLFSQGGACVFQGGPGPVLSEAKRDRARHAQRAGRSGGLQGGLGAQPPAGSRSRAPAGG